VPRTYSNILTGLYLANNRLVDLPEELSTCKSLAILDLSSNRLRKLPKCITSLTALTHLGLSDNRLVELPLELGRLIRLEVLGLEGADIMRMSTPPPSVVREGTRAVMGWLRDRMPPGAPPPARKWLLNPEKPPPGSRASTHGNAAAFTVFCYNVLAESYALPDRHPYCPQWVLLWSYRRQRLLREILSYDADVVCLQEVESKQFEDFFKPEMARAGYDGIYQAKSRARTMADWGKVDGCPLFFKTSKFTMIEHSFIEYQQVAMTKHREFDNDPDCLQRMIRRDNVAVIAVLRLKGVADSEPPIVVVNTHIHWDPSMCDVKLMQVAFLSSHIESLVSTTSADAKYPGSPTVICGDFNMEPSSGGFELLANGSIPAFHPDFTPSTAAAAAKEAQASERDTGMTDEELAKLASDHEAASLLDMLHVTSSGASPTSRPQSPSVGRGDGTGGKGGNGGAGKGNMGDGGLKVREEASEADHRATRLADGEDEAYDNSDESDLDAAEDTATVMALSSVTDDEQDPTAPRCYVYGNYTREGISHNLKLRSCYDPVNHPPTNYTRDFVGCLDYIWYTEDKLRVAKILEPVDDATVRETCLPNAYQCSDHTPILTSLELL
jgi:mRNA deadenylase 3'-5' endonuclease subunit Ccr4